MMGNPTRIHVRSNNRYSADTSVYMVRFCRLYGERDIEPFEVRAKSEAEAIQKAMRLRFGTATDARAAYLSGGTVDQCPITGKIAWCKGEKVVYLTGPMKIDAFKTGPRLPPPEKLVPGKSSVWNDLV